MFDWINNLTCGWIVGWAAAVWIIFSYTIMRVTLFRSSRVLLVMSGIRGRSFKQAVFSTRKIPCRSALIGEIL